VVVFHPSVTIIGMDTTHRQSGLLQLHSCFPLDIPMATTAATFQTRTRKVKSPPICPPLRAPLERHSTSTRSSDSSASITLPTMGASEAAEQEGGVSGRNGRGHTKAARTSRRRCPGLYGLRGVFDLHWIPLQQRRRSRFPWQRS